MATASKARPQATEQPELTIGQIIAQTLASDEPYQTAIEKLQSLEAARAKAQSQLDQVSATCTDTESLKRRLLEGEDIGDREQAFARRQALAQTCEAYALAIDEQRNAVNSRKNEASKRVTEALRPVYNQRLARMLATFEDLQGAFNEWMEIQQQINATKVGVTLNFYASGMFGQCLRQMNAHVDQHRQFDSRI